MARTGESSVDTDAGKRLDPVALLAAREWSRDEEVCAAAPRTDELRRDEAAEVEAEADEVDEAEDASEV